MPASLVLKEIMTVLVILEESGGKYYRELAEAQKDLQIRTLFTMLANDEARHRKIYGDICWRLGLSAELLAEDGFTVARIEEEFGLEAHKGAFRSIEDAIEASLKLERKTIRYLTDLEEHLPEHEQDRLKQLINEEKKHVSQLSELKARIKK